MLAALAADARAQGIVSGAIKLPDPAMRGEPPLRSTGFLPRLRNAIIPPQPYDPTPAMLVVLEPTRSLSGAEAAPSKLPTTLELREESFARPLYGVAIGGELVIENVGRNAHRLQAPAKPELIDLAPINPKGKRSLQLDQPHVPIVLEDADSTHLRAILVAFPHAYFSTIAPDGSFRIEGVPTGRWQVRIWYRTGWLKLKPPEVDVAPRGESPTRIVLPPNLEITAPQTRE
jgi:hypothetical protein